MSLYWIDFNLYVESIGIDGSTLGWLLAVSQLAGVVVALPASALSDRFGRRSVMVAGVALVALALFAFLPGQLGLLFVGVAAMGAGAQIVGVVQIPFMAEHTPPDQRNDYFSIWQAIQFSTGFLSDDRRRGGRDAGSPPARPDVRVGAVSTPAARRGDPRASSRSAACSCSRATGPCSRPRSGDKRPGVSDSSSTIARLFVRLLLPGFLTALGAGQLIPFLNVFIETKFDLDLAEVNAFFAIASLGTAIAILAQPAVARRFGRIGSIVLVQG